jgi:hypothetical protein
VLHPAGAAGGSGASRSLGGGEGLPPLGVWVVEVLGVLREGSPRVSGAPGGGRRRDRPVASAVWSRPRARAA